MGFEIQMPAELRNAYARRNADVKWIFAVKEEDPVPTVTNSPQPAGSTGNPPVYSGQAADKTVRPVKTGDDTRLDLYVAALIAAAGTFLPGIHFIKRRRRQ